MQIKETKRSRPFIDINIFNAYEFLLQTNFTVYKQLIYCIALMFNKLNDKYEFGKKYT